METIDRIIEMLGKSGMNNIQFSEKIGVKPDTITNWKSRKSKTYHKMLPEIASALNTTAAYLLGEVKNSSPHAITPDKKNLLNKAIANSAIVDKIYSMSDEEIVGYAQALVDYVLAHHDEIMAIAVYKGYFNTSKGD